MKTRIIAAACAAIAVCEPFRSTAEEEVVPNRIVAFEEAEGGEGEAAADGTAEPGAQETFSADNISAMARNSDRQSAENAESGKDDLFQEGMVTPPTPEEAKTLEEAIRNVLVQANKQEGTVTSNGIDRLSGMKYKPLGDGKTQIEWRNALRHLLYPAGYSFVEDGDFVLFGLPGEVDARYHELAQEKLMMNRTPISFTSGENGMDLKNAIDDISRQAGFAYTVDYMEKSDLYVSGPSAVAKKALSADDIGEDRGKAQVQTSAAKQTTFSTGGQLVEWRTVLKAVLNPNGYDFDEVEGIVRIAKPEKLKQLQDDAKAKAIAAKPLAARVIRLYHADPESVVERVLKIKGLLQHPNASLQATRKKDDVTAVVKNLNSRIQTSSGSQSGMSDTGGQVFDKLVRPRTIPAIIAYDVEDNMDEIEKKIRFFDIKEKQILIEAIIFQLETNNGDGDMDGIQWSGFENIIPFYGAFGKVADSAVTVGSRVVDSAKTIATAEGVTTMTAAKTIADSVQNTISYTETDLKNGFSVKRGRRAWMRTLGAVDFESMIQLIRSRSNAKLLSSPMIIVGDHSEAAIQVSRITPVPQIEASSLSGLTSGDNVQNSLNVQWNMVRDGILMWVSPEITERGDSVRLTVHPQVIDRGEKVDLSDLNNKVNKFNEYPVYNYVLTMHEMDTRATVPDGSTLMFGGLIKSREEETEDKVRWLGDIPLIGWLFRSKTTIKIQENLIVMIRPTILEDDEKTGYEESTLREVEPLRKNTGKDLRSTPLEGPYSVDEIKQNIGELYEERVVKPFRSKDGKAEQEAADTEPEPEFWDPEKEDPVE